MFVRVVGKRVVSQHTEFIFDAPDGMSMDEINAHINAPENFFKICDYVDYVDDGINVEPLRAFRNKRKPVLDDVVLTQEDICRMT